MFLNPEDVIHHNQSMLWYHVLIDVLEVEDWHDPSDSSDDAGSIMVSFSSPALVKMGGGSLIEVASPGVGNPTGCLGQHNKCPGPTTTCPNREGSKVKKIAAGFQDLLAVWVLGVAPNSCTVATPQLYSDTMLLETWL
jgi:hypothetical protein